MAEPSTDYKHIVACRFSCGCLVVYCPHDGELSYLAAPGCGLDPAADSTTGRSTRSQRAMAEEPAGGVPEDPTEALQLAADCLQYAAALALTDLATLPDEWHKRYGAVQQIIRGVADLGHNAIDAVPRPLGRRELYVDELGDPDAPLTVLGAWNIHTNNAIFCLGEAAGHWDIAWNKIGRIGVRDSEGDE